MEAGEQVILCKVGCFPSLYLHNAIADIPLLGNEVTTGGEPDESCSDATLEAVNVVPQQTPQTSRRDSNAMGLVISDSISLQGSLNCSKILMSLKAEAKKYKP